MDIKTMEKNFFDMKKNADIFDINCYIPSYQDSVLEEKTPTPEDMLKEGIGRLVLSDKQCLIIEAEKANENLLKRVADNDKFYAAPIILPEMNYAGKDFKAYLGHLIDNKAVILRAFPKFFKHSMKKWQMGDIFKAMEDRKIPLMVWHMELDFDMFAEIAEEYPNLPIIMEGSDQKTIYYVRSVMGLLERYKNIYLEMHNFTQYGFVPYLLEHIGSERLLFGSNTPYNDYNGILKLIDMHANDTQKKQIFSQNFERLMSEIKK